MTKIHSVVICGCGFPNYEHNFAEARTTTEEKYQPIIKEFDGQYSVSFNHPMTKDDFIAHVITVQYDRILVINLFAQQEAIVTLPQIGGVRIFVMNNKGELFVVQ